jgi:membrane protease YdiL (CAAX protease family)
MDGSTVQASRRARALSGVPEGAGPLVVLVGALVPTLRPACALILLGGWLVLRLRSRPEAIAWAATIPVGVALAWPRIMGPDAPLGERGCVDLVSVIVVHRLVLATIVLGVVPVLAVAHRSGPAELGLRRPSMGEAAVAIAGCLALVAGGLLIGPTIARPFFGELDFPVPPAALGPAILFGIANGVTEEVAYRGALQGWLSRVWPLWPAVGFQGLLFGIVHAGPEVVALLPVHIAILAGVGIAAGLVRLRSGSLAVPIGIHVGADIALYVGLACRAAG